MFPLARAWKDAAAPRVTGALDTQRGARTARAIPVALWVAIVLSVLEGPVRFALNAAHLDSLIFLRDALIFGSLAAFVAARAPKRAIPGSVGVFFVLATIHGAVSLFNIGSLLPALYGLKIFVPALCGFLVAESIFKPSPGVMRLVFALWVATVIGAACDQFWLDYPWVGLNVDLGGVDVFLGRDWQSGPVKRVAGLTRSSINLAVDIPLLSFLLLTFVRSRVARALVCGITIAVLVWTTQKGAILGYAFAVLALWLSTRSFTAPLKFAIVVATFLMVFAPTVLIFVDMPRDQGVFSFESLIERIERMWPGAWDWISRFPPFSGVGLGGIGGSQRFFGAGDMNAVDNLFLYLFANFGFASLLYLAAAVLIGLNAKVEDPRRDGVVLSSLVFLLMYGLVISLIEDQIASIWLGATLGWLTRLQPALVDGPLKRPKLGPARATR